MAYILYPRKRRYSDAIVDQNIPFILSDNDEYLDGPNFYLQERCSGNIDLLEEKKLNIGTYNRSRNGIHAIAHRLANILTWGETEAAHPLQGRIAWDQFEEWHVKFLYREAMVAGYWSQEYWATGNLTPLNYRSTIGPRLREAVSAFRWMATEGLMAWDTPTPSLADRQRSLRTSIAGFEAALPPDLRGKAKRRKYNKRADPGNWSPLTARQIQAIFSFLPRGAISIACLTIYSTGVRINEVTTNTLVPGSLHRRNDGERKLSNPYFPREAYRLKYNVADLTMVGVLPPEDLVFDKSAPFAFEMKILGKNKKIRSIWLLTPLLRQYWKYFVRAHSSAKTSAASAFLLNERGTPLSDRSLSAAILKARKQAENLLKEEINVTAHVLRHTFACIFLEAVIDYEARSRGLRISTLTIEQVESFASNGIVVLQSLLGHALVKDTLRYLRQFVGGQFSLRYLQAFSEMVGEALV